MGKYRIFISYSHTTEDAQLADLVFRVLVEAGLDPIYDKNFAWGHGFPEQIKNCISHAHVFVPIITEESSKRGWVHQEIGFATAMKIPVLPITRGVNPGEMLYGLQAINWEGNETQLKEQLSLATFTSIIARSQRNSRPFFECAEYQTVRTMMMVEYTSAVVDMKKHGRVRQMGALSSFHIPSRPIDDDRWALRYGGTRRDDYACSLLREERLILQTHATEVGCSLIIDPTLDYGSYGTAGRRSRLETLLEFLEEIPDEKIIIVSKKMDNEHNLTIVGDWFCAEAVTAALGKGYHNTIFTRHAPTVIKRLELFDQELYKLLQQTNLEPEQTKFHAITKIQGILASLT